MTEAEQLKMWIEAAIDLAGLALAAWICWRKRAHLRDIWDEVWR